MKKISLTLSALALGMVVLFSCAKEDSNENLSSYNESPKVEGIDLEISEIMSSKDFKRIVTMKDFNLISKEDELLFEENEIDWEMPITTSIESSNDVIAFKVKSDISHEIKGTLISLKKDNQRNIIFESYKNFNSQTGGTISYYFDQVETKVNVNTLVQNGRLIIENITMDEGGVERESWWSCTSGCYQNASNACSGDPECNTLCSALDLVGICTAETMIACGVHCM